MTDEHPKDWVRPDNYSSLEKGQVINVRRGSDGVTLVADLVVKDPKVISDIRHGNRREVSCGYMAVYEPLEGKDKCFTQKQIRGNHVAIVSTGRAGHSVAIRDSKPKTAIINGGSKTMNILEKMFASFTKDASPEELLEAAQATTAASQGQPVPTQGAADGDDGAAIAQLSQQVAQLTQVVNKLIESDAQVHNQVSGLDALENELVAGSGGGAGEESVTLEPEQITDEAGPVAPKSDLPDNPIPGADNAVMLNAIRMMKPVIAAIADPQERRRVSDAMATELRKNMRPTSDAQLNGYAKIQQAVHQNTIQKMTADNQTADETQLGQNWAKKFNPHYKEAK